MQFANFYLHFSNNIPIYTREAPLKIIQRQNENDKTANNWLAEAWAIVLGQAQITGPLPPAATFTYPSRWKNATINLILCRAHSERPFYR